MSDCQALQEFRRNELAYLAGFFDGEGCVGAYARKNAPHLTQFRMGCTNTILEPLKLFEVRFGGKVYGPKFRPNRLPQYEWALYDKRLVKSFLEEILPFLIVKKPKALEVYSRYFEQLAK